MENNLVVQMFMIFCMFLVVYGIKLQIWKGSKTTEYVILYAGFLAIISYFVGFAYHLMLVALGLLFLFVKAIYAKENSIEG